MLKEMLPDDGGDEEVRLIAHTKLSAQDSVLSTLSDLGDEPSSPNDIVLKETIQEEVEPVEGEGGGGGREGSGEQQKALPIKRVGSDGPVENMELKESNHVGGGGGGEKKENGMKETNVDEEKHLSPIEKKLSKQELFNDSNQSRPTVKRNRFTTQRDPFHKDRVPRKSVLKRTAPSPVTTFEARSPSVSPTGNGSAGDNEEEEDEISKYHQQQMDRKCCVVM